MFAPICEGTPFADRYAKNAATEDGSVPELETINPTNGGRKNEDVTSRRNFLVEVDNLCPGVDPSAPPAERAAQGERNIARHRKKYVDAMILDGIANRAVYSGNKSVHIRITLGYEPQSTAEYEAAALAIYEKVREIYGVTCDSACKNPARLTRHPGGRNPKTGLPQTLLASTQAVCPWNFHPAYATERRAKEEKSQASQEARKRAATPFVGGATEAALKTNRRNVNAFLERLRATPDGERHPFVEANIRPLLPQMRALHKHGLFDWSEFEGAAGTRDKFKHYRRIVYEAC